MLVNISDIQIKDRIRKDYGDIKGLAENINQIGLIQPITITPDYILIAGERRLMAVKLLGRTQIEANVLRIYDYEDILIREIAENEQRKDFTLSERQEYGRKLEQVERLKAEERKREHGGTAPGKSKTLSVPGLEVNLETGRTTDIVAKKVGLGSGKTYERLKTIVDSGNKELIEKVDKKEIGIRTAYNIVKGKEDKPVEKTPDKQKNIIQKELDETGFPKVVPIRPPQKDIFSISLFEEIATSFIIAINPLAYGAEIFKEMSGSDKQIYLDKFNEIRHWLDAAETEIKKTI